MTLDDYVSRCQLAISHYQWCGMNTMTDMASDDLPAEAVPDMWTEEEAAARLRRANPLKRILVKRLTDGGVDRLDDYIATVCRDPLATMDTMTDMPMYEHLSTAGWQRLVSNKDVQIATLERALAALVTPLEETSAPVDTSMEAVARRLDDVCADLLGGRTTIEQRRGLRSATDRADRVAPESDAAVGRALR